MELIIKGNVYKFKFGMGFFRAINKTRVQEVENYGKKEIGLNILIGNLIDGNVEALIKALLVANATEEPKVSDDLLVYYIDEECEDIDKLFKDVLDFLSKSNATKKTFTATVKMLERELGAKIEI